MSSDGGARNIPPFPPEYRAAGLLLHVTSLPSPYGIGDLGPSAFSWVDRLRDAGQRWWQALPLGPTGYGNSPYQSLSSFAGNVLLISPGGLISDGLLHASWLEDYALFRAWTNFKAGERNDLRPAYEEFRAKDYRWCIERLRALLAHVDLIRLDHFRGFAAAWHVPGGASTAQSGQWVQGPRDDFFQAVRTELGHLPFIAEDLGLITPDVQILRDQFAVPGTRVLQFASDGNTDNPYLPHKFVPNTVAYTGTHDNATTRQWYEELPDYQRQNLWNYLHRSPGDSAEAAPAVMRLAWSSVAALTVAPLQDVLNLGSGTRMNVPGRANGNWRWRAHENMLSAPSFEWLQELTETSNRSGGPQHQNLQIQASL